MDRVASGAMMMTYPVRVLAASAILALCATCSSTTPPHASAIKIGSREQLIGGLRALGDVGDFKISNGIIHAIIQDIGNSRGPGAFGGSLIDVDLVRGGTKSASL